MKSGISQYLTTLCERFGDGWNRFWFTPGDAYPLCVIRLLTGLVAIYLHLTFTPDLDRYFGPRGWLPIASVEQLELVGSGKNPGDPLYQPSYLNFITSPQEMMAVHLAGAVVLAMFTVGAFTRVTSVLALVVVLSYVHRAPMLTSQVEPIVTMVLFYLCLAPAGACLSVDAWLAKRKAARDSALSRNEAASRPFTSATIATRLIQVHLAMIYAVMAFSQLMSDTWWSGMGVWWLIARPESRLVDLTDLHRFPFVVEAWTHATVLFELAFPILVWNRLARPLLLGLALPVLGGIALITGQIPFVIMLLIGNLAYCSPGWLRSWAKSRSAPGPAVSYG